MNIQSSVDITPTPRILRTLGDIPFEVWQCFAELMDNSFDAFSDAENKGISINTPRIDVYWSNDAVEPSQREIVIEDNCTGMSLDSLHNAAKAGYSSNDPIHNLGLFGMGFNISTARLGDETTFLSATRDSHEWVGITISFADLIKQQSFSAPVVRIPKNSSDEMGTRIHIRKLKEGIFSELRKKETSIRRRLQKIYTPILAKRKVSVFIQGKQLVPIPHCVWSNSRFVMRKNQRVNAVIPINRDLGEGLFDIQRNRYLSDDEASVLDQANLPSHIIRRSRRLKGWVGIQRFCDTTDFGIDFIRNGRKILVSDKSLFGYENPDTGAFVTEYPIELGTTVGGRIVGEINVDYLIPTYQKNGFDTTDKSWSLTREALRGAGPILPRSRSSLGYDGDNNSPIGKLVNAYRRNDPGTKNLSIPTGQAREFAKKFAAGDPEYETDEKWYKIAQEIDRAAEDGESYSPVNNGAAPSDDVESYLNPTSTTPENSSNHSPSTGQSVSHPQPVPISSTRDDLIMSSSKVENLSGTYAYAATSPGMEVTAWKTSEKIQHDGERVPYIVFQDGIEIDFFYDPTHPIIAEYPITAKQLLLLALAEKFNSREGVHLQKAYLGLVDNHLADERINYQILQERSTAILQSIRDKMPSIIGHRFAKAKEIIKEVEPEEEQMLNDMLQEAPDLLAHYQQNDDNGYKALAYVPDAAIRRLILKLPEEFLDGKVFSQPYSTINNIGSEQMSNRIRQNSVDKIVAYMSDVIAMRQGTRTPSKNELIRYSNTLTLLEGVLV